MRLRYEPLPVPCQDRQNAIVDGAVQGPKGRVKPSCRVTHKESPEGRSAEGPRVYLRYLSSWVPQGKKRRA